MRTLTTILILVTLTAYGQNQNPIKLGLGIVAINDTYDESKAVAVYKDKDLKIKLDDFKLHEEVKNIWPYFLKPDYGLCYFVCLEKSRDYFKILINDKEEGFLKNDTDKYFKTWEALLIKATVERLDAKANPLRNSPSDHSETTNLQNQITVDRLQVLDIIEIKGEHWINVNYSKSGEVLCDKVTGDCGQGWIKWRAGDKLLVNILLLC